MESYATTPKYQPVPLGEFLLLNSPFVLTFTNYYLQNRKKHEHLVRLIIAFKWPFMHIGIISIFIYHVFSSAKLSQCQMRAVGTSNPCWYVSSTKFSPSFPAVRDIWKKILRTWRIRQNSYNYYVWSLMYSPRSVMRLKDSLVHNLDLIPVS